MKRMLACLLAAALCLCAAAAAGESEWHYDQTWGYLNGYSGNGGDVTVPSEVDGHPVRIVESKDLTRREDILSFTVPEGVIVLASHVMTGAKNLTSAVLPGTLQVMGDNCFFHCESLTEITIPASVRLMGIDVLNWCPALKTVTFEGPCPVLKDGGSFMKQMAKDTVIYVPDDQLEAYRSAMTAIKSEQIRPSGKNALPQPELHAEFTMDPETGTLIRCTSEDAWIEVPAEVDGVPVKRIGERAFSSNDFCYAVVLPEGLEEIGPEAFGGLSRLNYAPIPSTVRVIGEEAYAFYGGYDLTLPEGLTEISRRAFYRSALSPNLTVPEGVTVIGDEAFDGTNLFRVNLPSSLTAIGEDAFEGNCLEKLYLETLTLPEIAANAFEDQKRAITVSLPPAAGEAEVAAAQAFFDTLGDNFTVIRLDEPNGIYPDSPYAKPAETAAPEPEITEAPTETPAETVTETPDEKPTEAPATGMRDPDEKIIPEGVSMNPEDYVGTWYSIYYGTGGFTGDPRVSMDWQDVMTLNADGTVEENMGGSFAGWGVDPEDGWIRVGDVGIILLPDGYLQFNNRFSGYIILSKDKDAVWDPATPMFEDLVQEILDSMVQVTPEPTAAPAVKVSGNTLQAGNGSIRMDTKYLCIRYAAGGFEMDASVLGAELSVVLHENGSMDFIMLGNDVPGLTWTWDGNEAVADYYGAGELRFIPGDEGILNLDFMGTMTYILEAQ